MEPTIDKAKFGSITVAGAKHKHDIVIRLAGRVEKRPKKLSKAIYGTSHVISLEEAQHVYQVGAERLIVGAGQRGSVTLSPEAAQFFQREGCQVELLPIAEAIPRWNAAEGRVLGLFHVTC